MLLNKRPWKPYVIAVALTEAVGALSALLTRSGTQAYTAQVVKPPLSPPAAVFPVVWAALYALMGVGAARIWLSDPSRERTAALRLYAAQLAFNFVWSLLFFNGRYYAFAFFWLVALWALIVAMLLNFREVDRPAARMQIPYLLWVFFAGYLNFGVWMLNR